MSGEPGAPGADDPPPQRRLSRRTSGLDGRYWRLWGAVASSNLGDGLVSLALPWLASLLTRDALAIAGVALASRLPWLVFSLQAGVLTDRFDRRRLMVVANSLRAVIATGLSVAILLDAASLPLLYVAAFGLGMCEVVFDNTSQALLPSLVARERLERANGNLMGAQMVIADFVARPFAGALVGVALSLPFAIDAPPPPSPPRSSPRSRVATEPHSPSPTPGPGCAHRSGRASRGCGGTGCSGSWPWHSRP